MDQTLLTPTAMLDFEHSSIQRLIEQRNWRTLNTYEAIGQIYLFVRDEIKFGYNKDDCLPASRVLHDGYGQCNTKGTLLMALLRAVGVPTRCHGFTIYNELQRGAIPNYLFVFAPERIIHSWVEIYYDGQWKNLEGYILDSGYLKQVQASFANECDDFSGYAIATKCLKQPQIDWVGKDTYIQSEGIAEDLGIYHQPDEFYQARGSNLTGIKKWLFKHVLRHLMNANLHKIRRTGIK